jgi:AraC-like DNA-binding protein
MRLNTCTSTNRTPIFYKNAAITLVDVYLKTGETANAKEVIEQWLGEPGLQNRAEYYKALFDYNRALKNYETAFAFRDSSEKYAVKEREQYSASELLHATTEKKNIEHKMLVVEKQRNLNYFLFALTGMILLLALVVLVFINRQKIHRKNVALVKQILENNTVITTKSKSYSAQGNGNEVQSCDETEERKLEELFFALEKYMEDNYPFTNIECNRKTLAEALSTNETYLSQAIKHSANLTPKHYIDSYRLRFAKNLLLTAKDKYTIESIAFDSGFGSRDAFYDAFRRHYGLTPNQFKQIAE